MEGDGSRAVVERIDYQSAFRFTRLFGSFRSAIHPSRLLPALLLIVVVYIGGRVMDVIWGPRVLPNEFEQYIAGPAADFEQWRRRRLAERGVERELEGVFETALRQKLQLFDGIVNGALNLNLGVDQLAPSARPRSDSVIGGLRTLLLLPGWLWHAHKGFLIVYLVVFVLLWSLIGGAISRQTILDAAQDRLTPPGEAIAFVWRRWGWYILAPLLPLVSIGVLALLVAVPGWIAFGGGVGMVAYILGVIVGLGVIVLLAYAAVIGMALAASRFGIEELSRKQLLWSWAGVVAVLVLVLLVIALFVGPSAIFAFLLGMTQIVFGLAFVVFLLLGFAMALLLIGWVAGVHLVYPALSAEDTDAFDAVSRAFSYVLARPWRLILYSLVALGYGAATYLFIGLLVFLVIYLTQWAAGGAGVFERILPPPRFGELSRMPELGQMGWTQLVAGVLVRVWVFLLIGVLGAYVISYYFSVYSHIYLLLRQYADGTDPAEVVEDRRSASGGPVAQDKVEPGEEAAAGSDEGGGAAERTGADEGPQDEGGRAAEPPQNE